jgi:hypothetical protein
MKLVIAAPANFFSAACALQVGFCAEAAATLKTMNASTSESVLTACPLHKAMKVSLNFFMGFFLLPNPTPPASHLGALLYNR